MSKSRSHSKAKNREEIEMGISERKYYEKSDMSKSLHCGGFFEIPGFLPQFPLMDFDEFASQKENIHLQKKEGDLPLENLESEKSMHDDFQIEGIFLSSIYWFWSIFFIFS